MADVVEDERRAYGLPSLSSTTPGGSFSFLLTVAELLDPAVSIIFFSYLRINTALLGVFLESFRLQTDNQNNKIQMRGTINKKNWRRIKGYRKKLS